MYFHYYDGNATLDIRPDCITVSDAEGTEIITFEHHEWVSNPDIVPMIASIANEIGLGEDANGLYRGLRREALSGNQIIKDGLERAHQTWLRNT